MRNLKKILALVMALVLSLSLVTIASGADFNDADEIELTEAVDVMTAIGVLEGHNTGDFAPKGTLTREQAAKIITYMLLGDSADRLSVASTSFSDVAANHWSAADIEYCTTLGIIAGYGDGRFNPSGTLTGYAFAKMLLTAIGYDAEIENLTGAGWTINVSRLALQVGLDDGIEDISWGSSITREQAAQMALNAIKTPLVQYDNGVTVIVNGEPVTFGSGDAYYVTTTLAREQRISDATLSNTNDIFTVEFGERYFPRLILAEDIVDEFGRPAHIWTYETNDIGTYLDENLLEVEYTDAVEGRDVYNDIGYSVINQYDLYVFVDGARSYAIDKTDLTRNNSDTLANTGKGVLTQVFVDHDKEEITIVIINTYLAKVAADYNERTEILPISIYYGYTTDNSGEPVEREEYKRLELEDFDNLADFAEGDLVKITMAAIDNDPDADLYDDYVVQSIEEADVISGVTVTSYTATTDDTVNNVRSLDTVTADGTEYDTAAKAYYDAGIMYNYNEILNQLRGSTYNLYMDDYGNVLGIEPVEVANNYIFVVGYNSGYSPIVESVDQALVITPEGELKVVPIRDDEAQRWSNNANDWVDMDTFGDEEAVNTWFTYTMDGDTYVLNRMVREQGRAVMGDDNPSTVDISGTYATLPVNSIITEDGNPTEPAAAYGNDNSVYITVDANTSVDSTDPAGSIVKVNGVTTGIKNTNIEVDDNVANLGNFDNAVNINYWSNAADHADTFFLYNSNGYVTYAVVVGEDASSSDNLMYFASGATGRHSDSELDFDYVTYDVILNNELIEAKVKDNVASGVNPQEGQLYIATIDQNGYVTDLDDDDNLDGDRYLNETNLMNTTANEANGYAFKTGIAPDGIDLTLIGAVLWVTEEADEDNYVVIDSGCVVFVKGADDSSYEEYTNIETALATLSSNDSESGAYIDLVVAICDNTNGYATTLIIREDEVVNTFSVTATVDTVDTRGGQAAHATPTNNDGAVTYTWYSTTSATSTNLSALNSNFTADGATLTAKAGTTADTYYFRVRAVDAAGNVAYDNVEVDVDATPVYTISNNARIGGNNIAVNIAKDGFAVADGTPAVITVQQNGLLGWTEYLAPQEYTAKSGPSNAGWYSLENAAENIPNGTYRLMIEIDGTVLYSGNMVVNNP